MRVKLLAMLAVVSLVALGCEVSPVTGERQLRLIDTGQEVQMGQRVDQEIRSQYRVVTGTPEAQKVEQIGRRIEAVSDRQEFPYHFALLESDELNAFAAPGGYVYVTSELLKAVGDDDELAAVIGHEVAHIAAGHSVQQVQRAMGFGVLTDLIFGPDGSAAARVAADVAFNAIVLTGYSREAEYEADLVGIRYASEAGFDPRGMARFFETLQAREARGVDDRRFEFLMSHPNTQARRDRALQIAAQYEGGRPVAGR